MIISRIRLEKISQFRDFDMSFVDCNGGPIDWTVLLGDNGVGKTTLLRCIAFGLCDESSAAGLVRERKGGFVRKRSKEGVVYIEFIDDDGQAWTIRTTLTPFPRIGERVRQKIYQATIDKLLENPDIPKTDQDKFPWQSLFVSAYGSGRTPDGREEYSEYRSIDAVYTLFQYEQPLQSPELAWRRMLDAARRNPRRGSQEKAEKAANNRIETLLRHVLMLDEDEDVYLDPTGIKVTGPGYDIPLSSHADGYKSTTNWLLDLLAWRMLANRGLDPKTMSGVVIVDEIEQHLHPRWQRYIIPRLRDQFPRVQFIVTTHSPLCVAGATDLEDHECQLVGMVKKGSSIISSRLPMPRGYRADQILTAEDYFNLPDTRSPSISEDVAEYRRLFQIRSRSDSDEVELQKLGKRLGAELPDIASYNEQRLLRDDLTSLINHVSSLIPGESTN